MADKQAQLNGAYYGPSIPPKSSQSYHRPGRGGDPLGCCCSCIFGLIFKLIMTAIIVLGLAALIFWLIVRPNRVKFHVTEATLTQFNFSNDNTLLHYNMALNLSVRNPNKKIGIYYDRIEARAFYGDQRFSTVTVDPFYQGHKTTNMLNPVFQGQQVVVGTNALSEYSQQNSTGIYEIDVKLYLRVRFKFGLVKTGKFKPKIECDLKVPLSQNGYSVGTFQTTKCDVDYF